MKKLVYGVGISEKGEFAGYSSVGGKSVATKEYELWRGMLTRCYNEKFQQNYPTYVGCSVSEGFKYFQRFAKWCNTQNGFGVQGYHLDKDILVRGNKVYSEDICVFVPGNINNLLIKRGAVRGDCPIGVTFRKKHQKYQAQCSDGNGNMKYLGYFPTPNSAFQAYKTFKEALIKRLALEYRDTIDPRVYEALMQYEVNIND